MYVAVYIIWTNVVEHDEGSVIRLRCVNCFNHHWLLLSVSLQRDGERERGRGRRKKEGGRGRGREKGGRTDEDREIKVGEKSKPEEG